MKTRLCALVAAAAVFICICACTMPSLRETAPASPKSVRIIAGSPPTLTWDAVPGARYYKIYCSCLPDEWPSLENQSTASTQVECCCEGYYTVSAVNSGGESARSDNPALYGPPAAPRNVRIEKEGSAHYLRWDAVYGAESYIVYRAATCHPSPFPPLDTISGFTATEYSLAVSGYCYWVAAVAAGKVSELSENDVAYY
jgi:hypothetical protein